LAAFFPRVADDPFRRVGGPYRPMSRQFSEVANERKP
jgi:hypothetical protein